MDKIVKKFISGTVGGAFDAAMSSFPGIAIVWGAIKGGVASLKEERANEFILFIQNNILLENFRDEKFIDGLAITFENYLRQRVEFKRSVIKSVFLGFVNSNEKDNFELERYYDILNKINKKQVEILKLASKKDVVLAKLDLLNEDYHNDYFDFKYLEFLGILSSYSDREVREFSEESIFSGAKLCGEEKTCFTEFGLEFIKYVTQ